MDCLFCKIVEGNIPSKKVYEDEYVYAFEDVQPVAPVHVLFVPKKHLNDLNDIGEAKIMTNLFRAVDQYTRQIGLSENGFRTVINTGKDGQQTVQHLHIHVIGGRSMQWPPG